MSDTESSMPDEVLLLQESKAGVLERVKSISVSQPIPGNQYHIAIMSPDRFFCDGIRALLLHTPLPALQVHYCHSLKTLRELMDKIPFHGIMLREIW